MDITLINPALKSITAVFSTLASTNLTSSPLKTKNKNEFVYGKSIAGVMNLVSNCAQASVVIIFPEQTILNLANKIMPETVERVDAVVIDLVGEITNIVSGGVKRTLENEGYLFDLSLPTIIMGNEYLVAYLPDAPIIAASFATPYGELTLETCFKGVIDYCPINFDGGKEVDDIFF